MVFLTVSLLLCILPLFLKTPSTATNILGFSNLMAKRLNVWPEVQVLYCGFLRNHQFYELLVTFSCYLLCGLRPSFSYYSLGEHFLS